MSAETIRVTPEWLVLREPADAAARSTQLAVDVGELLRGTDGIVVHDLGCGTGSMMRWLAPRLPGPQHWALYDRDQDLLDILATGVPAPAADGRAVTVETRNRDITRLSPDDLHGASLVTASALLDMLTLDELTRLVQSSAQARCPILVTLSVVGRVDITPADQADGPFTEAFNDHQRRTDGGRTLLGPDAVDRAARMFDHLGYDVQVRPSPWVLAPGDAALTTEWLIGWLDAACEQRPELLAEAHDYLPRRRAQAEAGLLAVTVHHHDLLAVPT